MRSSIINAMVKSSHDFIIGGEKDQSFDLNFAKMELSLAYEMEKDSNTESSARYAEILRENYNSRNFCHNQLSEYRNLRARINSSIKNNLSLESDLGKAFINEQNVKLNNLHDIEKLYNSRHNHLLLPEYEKSKIVTCINEILDYRSSIPIQNTSFSDHRCNQIWGKNSTSIKQDLLSYYDSLLNKMVNLQSYIPEELVRMLQSPALQKYAKKNILSNIYSYSYSLGELLEVARDICESHFGLSISIKTHIDYYELCLSIDESSFILIVKRIESSSTYTSLSSDDIFPKSKAITYLSNVFFDRRISIINAKTLFHEIGHLLNIGLVTYYGKHYHSLFLNKYEVCSQIFEQIGVRHLIGSLKVSSVDRELANYLMCYDITDEMKQVEFAIIDIIIHNDNFTLDESVCFPYESYTNFSNMFTRVIFFQHLFGGELEAMYSIYPLNSRLAYKTIDEGNHAKMFEKYFCGIGLSA
ncbi:hypothetical protein FXE30_12520 [Vibrio cholerae]|uniref:hypothetical protein n=1 Tax=Vibrio cholerae TaxID=666 RepID=UPI0011D6EF75|nr:hypothetical protein [Vibrio cholerae]TXZ93617.1 hypothetical protein FXE30_12520 [Vibrio cholerae]GHX72103.1 hypothetical protein VCSRO16_3360 [Vibrio cholerae]